MISSEQYNNLLVRLNQIEDTLNDLITVLNKTTTASTISKVIVTFETELDDIKNRIVSLESQVEELVADPYNEQT